MPRVCRVDFLFEAAKQDRDHVKLLIEHVLDDFEADPTPQRKEELSRLCDLVITTHKARKDSKNLPSYCWRLDTRPFPDDSLGMAVKASFQLQRSDLLQSAVSMLENKLPPWAYEDIGKGLHLVQFPREIQDGYDPRLPILHK